MQCYCHHTLPLDTSLLLFTYPLVVNYIVTCLDFFSTKQFKTSFNLGFYLCMSFMNHDPLSPDYTTIRVYRPFGPFLVRFTFGHSSPLYCFSYSSNFANYITCFKWSENSSGPCPSSTTRLQISETSNC